MTIEAILFDLDGTLLDRHTSLVRFVNQQYTDLVFNATNVSQNRFVERFIELDNRGYVWKDKVYQQLIAEFDISNYSWEELLEQYISGFPTHAVAFPYVSEILQSLQRERYKLGMITNGRTHFQLSNVRELGIERFFDVILVSEAEGISKPDSEIFLRALSKLEVAPNQAIYIGDHPLNDVAASRQIGMKGIWKEDKFFTEAVEHDGIIRNWPELISLIKKITA